MRESGKSMQSFGIAALGFLKKKYPSQVIWEPVEKGSFAGCSKMSRCEAPEILSREAYFWYVERRRMRGTKQMGVFSTAC